MTSAIPVASQSNDHDEEVDRLATAILLPFRLTSRSEPPTLPLPLLSQKEKGEMPEDNWEGEAGESGLFQVPLRYREQLQAAIAYVQGQIRAADSAVRQRLDRMDRNIEGNRQESQQDLIRVRKDLEGFAVQAEQRAVKEVERVERVSGEARADLWREVNALRQQVGELQNNQAAFKSYAVIAGFVVSAIGSLAINLVLHFLK